MTPRVIVSVATVVLMVLPVTGAVYSVGPGEPYATIGEVPWESVGAGDEVVIHWRSEPYREKWVICRRGTEEAPIVVRGVAGPGGELPVISGDDAVTRTELSYWNEVRGVLKIGGASVPADTLPAWIVVEGLEIRSGRPAYTFTDDGGSVQTYADNAAAIYVEKAEHLIIRDCVLADSGNGLFIGAFDGDTQEILIQGNRIEGNGIDGSYYQHNTYTAARGITYELNRLGPLRDGCGGNNLKDRSAGLVVRYNWIEGGNRQLDLVDAEDTDVIVNDPRYRTTHVYGNVLLEPSDQGNSQIVHYGGDSGNTAIYRKGTLHFYGNTVVSRRTGNTTLLRLSTNDETADVRDNIVYVTADGWRLGMLDESGTVELSHNWLPSGWVDCHGTLVGTVNNDGTSVEGTDPGFLDGAADDFHLTAGSSCLDAGTMPHADVFPRLTPALESVDERDWRNRLFDGSWDLGAFELGSPPPGDIDGDAHITPLDVDTWLAWRYRGIAPAGDPDCDGSGAADAPDLVLILGAAWAAPE